EYTDDYGAEAHKSSFKFTGKSGGFTYSDETFGVSGCAGYAQARSYAKVSVSTASVDGTVTLWGQPFSLG
ncbi:MspA family porin, partial [Rhodococcus opacus]